MKQILLKCWCALSLSTAFWLLFTAQQAHATTVKPLNLNEMTQSADKIFRGEVVSIEPGLVQIGGGQLTTTIVTMRVRDLLKGQLPESNGKRSSLITLQMIGSPKPTKTASNKRFVGGFRTPVLVPGNEYLLFTTTPSSAGLSMTVGVGQGLFSFHDGSFVRNEFNNVGLFRGMANAPELSAQGAIDYNTLASQIERLLGN